MKKLKNPRKYIERLKRRVANLEEWSRESNRLYFKQKGSPWLTLKNGAFRTVAVLSADKQDRLRIGQKLRIEAEIVAYSGTLEEITVTMELKSVSTVASEE